MQRDSIDEAARRRLIASAGKVEMIWAVFFALSASRAQSPPPAVLNLDVTPRMAKVPGPLKFEFKLIPFERVEVTDGTDEPTRLSLRYVPLTEIFTLKGHAYVTARAVDLGRGNADVLIELTPELTRRNPRLLTRLGDFSRRGLAAKPWRRHPVASRAFRKYERLDLAAVIEERLVGPSGDAYAVASLVRDDDGRIVDAKMTTPYGFEMNLSQIQVPVYRTRCEMFFDPPSKRVQKRDGGGGGGYSPTYVRSPGYFNHWTGP